MTSSNYSSWPLNQALSRVSDLLGVHTSAYQYEVTETDALDIHQIWLAAHPTGAIREIHSADELKHIHHAITGLWIHKETQAVHVLRGTDSNNDLVFEDAAKQLTQLSFSEGIEKGALYLLSIDPDLDDSIQFKRPTSATDWFLYTIKQRKAQIKDSILASTVMNSLALATSMYSMQVYDRVIPAQSNSTLIVLTVGALIAIAFEFVMKQLRSKLMDHTFKGIDLELSSVFFNQAMGIRMDARPKNVGTFISEIRQFESIRGFMTSATLFVLADAPFALFFIVFMSFIGGYLGLIPLVFMIIMLVTGFHLSNKLKNTHEGLVEEGNRKNGLLIESMDGIESIKAAAAESQILKQWQKISDSQSNRELYHRHISHTTSTIAAGIQQLAYIGTVAAGVLLIHNNQLTMGGLIGCTILSGRILGPLTQIPQLLVQWGQIKYSLEGLNRIMAMPTDTENHKTAIIPEKINTQITMENISFSYEKDHATFATQHLQFESNEIVVVMGRVGSGKSTFLKLLSGLYKPSTGRVLLDKIDMTHLPSGLIREKIGYLPQDVRLIRGTLKDNLTLGIPYVSDSQILEATARTGLDKLIQKNPLGLGLPIAEGGLGLSGGQKQMVALSRLFLADPPIILLDEPTASLDSELEAHVLRKLFENRKDKLIVMVSHKPSVIQFATRLIIIDNGQVIQNGPKAEVVARLQELAAKQKAGPTQTTQH